MKLVKGLFKFVLILLVLVIGLAVGGYFYIRSAYDIDVLSAIGIVRTVNEPVDEAELCPNAFDVSDMVDVQTEVNQSVENMIEYSLEHGYSINFDRLPSEMKYIIKLTDRQIGALTQTVLEQEWGGKITVGDWEVPVQLLQTDFLNVSDSSMTMNMTAKLDISAFKEKMDSAPLSWFKKWVPDELYISSTVDVLKGLSPFEYTVQHNSLTVNGLDDEDTEELFHILDTIFDIGTAEDMNMMVGTAVVDSMIGSEENKGIAYSLKEIGAKDYLFLVENGEEYFSVTL